eukprot:jgi/Orpsp1_1/1176343/evm.model.c7180000057256.1
MNNLSLIILGLALINVPVCLSQSDKQCFSQPDYPCCKGNEVVYTDESGDWGVENDQWCGIVTSKDTCFSTALGYPCCKSCEVLYTDESGEWGAENGNWCGIKKECAIVPVPNDSDFDFSFLKLENNKENMLYSPLSIKYALKMLEEGAVNNTYNEINKVLGNVELIKYKNIKNFLSLANGMFIKDRFYEYVKPEYINLLKEKYEAEVIEDEFKNANNINGWIKDKTFGVIKDMISDDIVKDPRSEILLINALAIDMRWENPFNVFVTSGSNFYLDNGESIEVTTMNKSKESKKGISYYIDNDITVLTMDLNKYDEIQFEFMAIMPKENLSGYIEKISKEEINQIDKRLKSSYDEKYGVDIHIPRFKFEYELNLKEDLMKLGIHDAFNATLADFKKITDLDDLDQQLFVSDASHKANVEFYEEGMRLEAGTYMLASRTSQRPVPSYPVEIRIDKPFMFIVRDKNQKDIWFTGAIYKPNLWEKDNYKYGTIYNPH